MSGPPARGPYDPDCIRERIARCRRTGEDHMTTEHTPTTWLTKTEAEVEFLRQSAPEAVALIEAEARAEPETDNLPKRTTRLRETTPARTPTTADAAWEELRRDIRSLEDTSRRYADEFIARHRPLIEAAIRAKPRAEGLREALGLIREITKPVSMTMQGPRWMSGDSDIFGGGNREKVWRIADAILETDDDPDHR